MAKSQRVLVKVTKATKLAGEGGKWMGSSGSQRASLPPAVLRFTAFSFLSFLSFLFSFLFQGVMGDGCGPWKFTNPVVR